jgi:hypothetical protein
MLMTLTALSAPPTASTPSPCSCRVPTEGIQQQACRSCAQARQASSASAGGKTRCVVSREPRTHPALRVLRLRVHELLHHRHEAAEVLVVVDGGLCSERERCQCLR